MISEDKYCDDVLNQITSAQSALNSVRIMLLENHINSCVAEQLAEGDKSVIDELMKTIARMVR
jgi:DNA-binding FrmR family transcriptional regulator